MIKNFVATQWDRFTIPEPNTGCVFWCGYTDKDGYGTITLGKKTYKAHRIAFERRTGIKPAKLFVCHKCDIPSCVNPEHLFLGTPLDNVEDMLRKGRSKSRHTHCKWGHPLSGDNLYIYPNRKGRGCRICRERPIRKIKTHCKYGHEFTEANTYTYSGSRICKTCSSARSYAWNRRKNATKN